MIKKCLLTIILFTLFSCKSKIYVSEIQNQNTGLDFTRGKWLVNEIDCPKEVYGKLYGSINQDFDNYLKGRLFLRNQINSILLPKKINFNPSKTELMELKKSTLFDYFVNVKAEKLRDDLKLIDITNHKNNKRLLNKCSVTIEVYDLNLLEILYSKKITGTIRINENDNSDIHFNTTTNQLIMGCYKKIFKDIEKKSIN